MEADLDTAVQERICSKCPERGPQPLSAFAKNPRPGKPDNRRTTCKTCCNEYIKNYKKNPPPKRQKLTREEYKLKSRQWTRKTKLKAFYNFTEDEYQAMYEAQGGVCAVCGEPETWENQYGICPLSVEHDHFTGQVRALVCADCNRKIAAIENSPECLAYLKKHRSAVLIDLIA